MSTATTAATKLSFVEPMSINDLRRAIPVYGPSITLIIKSEPGVGKSSLLAMLAEDNGDKWRKPGDELKGVAFVDGKPVEGTGLCANDKYDYIYVDCPCKDIPDIGMNIPVHASKTLEFYVAALFRLDSNKPKVVMLDEYMKTPKMLQIMFTRMTLELMVGDRHLPDGSYVFATSNNESDGVGDSMLAHGGNRVMIVPMRKSSTMEWLKWAGENNIARPIRAWVAMNPQVMASYLDGGQENNPYIFWPNKGMLSFCSLRSLAKCDVIVRNDAKLGRGITRTALAGTIGVAGANDMAAFLSLEKELVSTKDVLANPDTVQMPEKAAALFMMMFNALDDITIQDELTSFMKFMARVESNEVRGVFFTMLIENKRTFKLAKNNADVMAWAKDKDNLAMLLA